ncbi:MAG: hypothetical protein ACOYVD_18255 [Bacillota bacterium]
MVLFLDLDWIGSLIFLWFIFQGFKNSRNAKRKFEERRQDVGNRRDARPAMPKTQPRNEPKHEPGPSWFPFEQLKEELRKQEMKRQELQKEKKTPAKTPKIQEQPIQAPPRTAVPLTVIEVQEKQWKTSGSQFDLSRKAVVNGMIWSEIIGPPKAKRKHNFNR